MTSQAPAAKVKAANAKMIAAWHEGRELLDRLGPRAKSGAMIEASGENISEAERLRKLRGMSARLTEKEVREICNRCEEYDRQWGPQYLVALYRIPQASRRRKVVTRALRDGWGLKELQRAIRVELAQSGTSVRRNRQGTGRRRKIDWTDSNEIADEVQRMCLSWANLHSELQSAAVEQEVESHLDLLPEHLRKHFNQVSRAVVKMLEASKGS